MPFLPNTPVAGTVAGDPLLKGLRFEIFDGASSMDVATVTDTWLDSATTPNTNSTKASLSPAATVTTSGTAGTYNDTSKQLTIASTTGLSVGDYLVVAHSSVNAGAAQFVKILTIVSAGVVTLVSNPFNTLGNLTNIQYQTAWRYLFITGAGFSPSSAGGSANYSKFQAADALGNNNNLLTNTFYVADAPAGASYVSINGQNYASATGNTVTPSINILSAWANKGGIATVELVNHSVQARNDFQFSDSTVAEKALSAVNGGTLKITAGDGIKYGALRFRSIAASSVSVTVDIQYTADTTAPTLIMGLAGVI